VLDGVSADVGQERLFAEKIAAAAYSVLKRNGEDGETTVFVDGGKDFGVNSVEDDFEVEVRTEIVDLWLKNGFQVGWAVDVEWGSTSQKVLRGDQSHQSETMITMHVGDKNGLHAVEVHTIATQGQLGSFCTIHQKVFLADVDDVGTSVVAHRGQGASTPQDCDLEFLHTAGFCDKLGL